MAINPIIPPPRRADYTDAFAANLHDSDPLTNGPCRALWVGSTGSVKVKTVGGNDVTIASVPSGALLTLHVIQVFNTGTSASSIIALY